MSSSLSKISRYSLALLALSFTSATLAQNPQAITTQAAPIVFFDIAGQDIDVLRSFYNRVFGWSIGAEANLASPLAVAVASPLQGILRREAADKIPPHEVLLYLGVADVAQTLDAVVANGGGVVYPRIEVPGAVVMGLFTDPAGNRFGLIEIENGKAKVPQARN